MSQPASRSSNAIRSADQASGAEQANLAAGAPVSERARANDPTPSPPTAMGRARRRLVATVSSYRLRVLIWFIALLGLGTFATIAVLTEVLLQRTDERVRADLVQEAQEFRQLAGGIDPATGAPFGAEVERIFDVFLSRSIPSRNEVFVTFVDGDVYQRTGRRSSFAIETDPTFLARVADAPDSVTGRLATPAGAVDYQAIPVRVDGQTRGVFAVAIFRDLERSEQDEVFGAALIVGLILLVIGSLLAWRLADRVLAPVRQTAATARSISETDLSRRVDVRGNDEFAELARTFNEMLDRVGTAFSAVGGSWPPPGRAVGRPRPDRPRIAGPRPGAGRRGDPVRSHRPPGTASLSQPSTAPSSWVCTRPSRFARGAHPPVRLRTQRSSAAISEQR